LTQLAGANIAVMGQANHFANVARGSRGIAARPAVAPGMAVPYGQRPRATRGDSAPAARRSLGRAPRSRTEALRAGS